MIRKMMDRAKSELKSVAAVSRAARFNRGAKIGTGVKILGNANQLLIGDGTEIEDGAILDFRFGGSITLGRSVKIYSGAILAPYGGHINLGDECGVNHYTILYGHGGLDIGNFVRFAAQCLVIPANHGFQSRLQPIHTQPLTQKGIRLGNDIWIGGQSTILDGVTIGDGSVIAAGSVVSRDIDAFVIAAGIPAKPLRGR